MHPLDDILTRAEGKSFERKRDLTSPASILRSVVAFANGAGGQLVVGIDDDGALRGVEDPIADEERLANVIAHGATPMVVPDIALVERDGHVLLLVTVSPSARRPHFVTADGSVDGTYVRIGASNRRADEALRAELARSARRRGFDEEPATGTSIDDIDAEALSRRVGRVLGAAEMRTLKVVADVDGTDVPTNAGLLVAAPSVVEHRFPDAVVHAAVFTDSDTAVLRRTLTGTVFELVEQCIAFVRSGAGDRVSVTGDGLEHRAEAIVPQRALRELVVNAFVHADYSLTGGPFRVAVHPERVVIENPGLLVPGMAIDDLGQGVAERAVGAPARRDARAAGARARRGQRAATSLRARRVMIRQLRAPSQTAVRSAT